MKTDSFDDLKNGICKIKNENANLKTKNAELQDGLEKAVERASTAEFYLEQKEKELQEQHEKLCRLKAECATLWGVIRLYAGHD